MEEIDIRDMLSYFLNKIIVFTGIIAVVVILGCIYSMFLQKPLYTSKTSIILTGFSNSEQSTITQSDLTINSKLVSTYKSIVKSRKVLTQVQGNLNLNYSYGELANMVSVSAVTDTEIIEIAITCKNAKEAYEIANEVAEVFSVEVKDLYNLSNVSILDYAEINNVPSNVNVIKQIIISFALGCILAFVIVFLIYYFDTTVKGAQDIEKKYGFVILGCVPDYDKKKRGSSK